LSDKVTAWCGASKQWSIEQRRAIAFSYVASRDREKALERYRTIERRALERQSDAAR
jgi:hypothetical protein